MRTAESPDLSQQSDDQLGSDSSLAGAAEPKQRSGPTSRSSPFIGVTMYKKSGRWEAHIWDSTPTPAKGGKGKQLHLGSFLGPEPAAVAYDRAALKLRGPTAVLNHTKEDYDEDEFMKKHGLLGKAAFIAELRAWAKTTKPPARTRRLRTAPGAATLAEDEQQGSADSSYSSAADRRRSVSSRRRTRGGSPGSSRVARRTFQELTEVERYEQQQHHTSGRGTTPAPLPYAGAAQLPAFQLRAQPLQGQGAAAEHVLGGSQEVWQQEGIMPGLQAGTGGLSLRGLQPALQDGTMLALEGTNPMLGSSMLLDSPDSSGSALSSLNLLDVCGLHHEGWQRFQGMPGAGISTLLPTFLLGGASPAAAQPSPASVAARMPGYGPTPMQHALAGAPHHDPDSPQTSNSSAARLAAGNAAASAAGGSLRAAWSTATSAAAWSPQDPAAWSRGINESLSASDSSRMLGPEPAAPHRFPFMNAASMPMNLSLFTGAALGTPPPAAGSQAPPSLLGYPPLLGTETSLHVRMGDKGTADCLPGAAAPRSCTWSADGLLVAPGIEYLPGSAAILPYPAHVSSPVDCATLH